METKNIYWLTHSEIKELYYKIINAIEENHSDEVLHRIQSEISVIFTRNETTIMPSSHIVKIMELPENSFPIRLSEEEVNKIKNLNIRDSLFERFK